MEHEAPNEEPYLCNSLYMKLILAKWHKYGSYYLLFLFPFISKIPRAFKEPLNSPCERLLADFQLVQ